MMAFFRKTKGSISIFLCLILLPMVTYSSMIIDASRMQSSKTLLQSAGDLTMNAALSEYEQILQDMYGLFATAESPEAMKPALENYFNETIAGILNSSTSDDEYTKALAEQLTNVIWDKNMTEDDVTNFLAMKVEEFSYEPIPESRISNPLIMKSQIIDYMKYKGPVSLASNLMTKLGFLQDSSAQTEAVEKKVEYTQAVSDLGDPMEAAWKAIGHSDGSMENSYNKYADQYEKGKYEDKATVFGIVERMSSKLHQVAEYIVLYNNQQKYVTDAFGYSDYYDNLDTSAYASTLSTTDLESEQVDDVDDAKEKMDKILNKIMYNVYNLEQTSTVQTTFETSYGDLTFNYDENDAETLNSVTIGAVTTTSSDYIPHYANTQYWIGSMTPMSLTGTHIENIKDIFETQVDLASHASDLAEYKAYYEYFKKLKGMYDTLYLEYEDELKNGTEEETTESTTQDTTEATTEAEENEEYKKYKDYYTKLTKIAEAWPVSATYTSYISCLNAINVTYYYTTEADKYAKDATTEFSTYYTLVKNLETTSKAAVDALDKILEQLGTVEEAGENWTGSIDKVNDDATKSQMKSDYGTLSEGIEREDVQALRDVMNTIHTQFENLKKDIEAVKYFGIQACTGDGKFEHFDLISNSYLQAEETDIKSYNTILLNLNNKYTNTDIRITEPLINKYADDGVFNETMSANIKPADLIDGKKANAEDPNEAFYYVLKNTFEAKGDGISTDAASGENSDKSVVDELNKTGAVGEDGQPSADLTPKATTAPAGSGGGSTETTVAVTKGDASAVSTAYKAITGTNTTSKDNGEYGKVSAGGGIPTDSDADFKDNSGKGKDSLNAAKSLLADIAKIGTNLRNDVYLEEYFTEMFTCQTDTKLKPGELLLLNGYTNQAVNPDDYIKVVNTQNAWYGKEIEFILWGNSDLNKNLKTTEGYIFLVRFALNAIYAFTASDIQSFASSVATALVGWSVVLVPIVQVCITLGIALAESAYDLAELKNGEDIPIIKNSSTFVCSPTGALREVGEKIVDKVAEEVVDTVEEKIDEQLDKLGDLADKKISECTDEINSIVSDYGDQLTESVVSSIEDQMVTPLINSITPALSKLDDTKSNATALVEEAVDDAWALIEINISAMEDGTIKTLTLAFYNECGEAGKQQIISAVTDAIDDATGDLTPEVLRTAIMTPIENWIGDFEDDIEEEVKKQTDKMKEEIMKHGDEAASNLKSYLNEQIEDAADKFSGQVKEKVSSTIKDHAGDVITSVDKSGSGGLTLNYKEYCKIFMFIKLLSNDGETQCLQRAAALIQANVRYAAEDANQNFDMTKSYTMVYIGADVKLKTLFPWAVSVDTGDGTTTESAKLDLENLGDNVLQMNYSGINGY